MDITAISASTGQIMGYITLGLFGIGLLLTLAGKI